ncbi:MAG TPA: phosphopantetheine-binding protein [Pseudonocardiaceae bacterium]
MSPGAADAAEVEDWLRGALAEVTGLPRAEVSALPADTPLLGDGLALTSLAGVHLLAAVRTHWDVDVALLDLGLDSLESIAALRDFITTHA